MTDSKPDCIPEEADFWGEAFFRRDLADPGCARSRENPPAAESALEAGETAWLASLFMCSPPSAWDRGRIRIFRDGVELPEISIEELSIEVLVGRHPDARIRLEDARLSLFHLVLRKRADGLYVEGLDGNSGTLLNREWLVPERPERLSHGDVVEVPGYRLRFHLPDPDSAAGRFGEAGEGQVPDTA